MNADPKMKMEWTDDVVLSFIHEVQSLPLLWHHMDPSYKIISKKNDAWESLSEKFQKSTSEVKKKWQSLQASYRRERGREGSAPSNWFAYEAMKFLKSGLKPRVVSLHKKGKKSSNHVVEDSQNYLWDPLGDDIEIKHEQILPNTAEKSDDRIQKIIQATKPLATMERNQETESSFSNVVQRNDSFSSVAARNDSFPSVAPRNDNVRDEFEIYGEYIATKLRKLDTHSGRVAQHYINKTLFEAEMGRYKELFISSSDL